MKSKPSTRHARRLQGLTLLYEDRDILVVDKAPGLLTVGTDKERTKTAYYRLTDYVRKGNAKSRHRIFIVHRLDRDVSGILVFARTPEAKERLQGQWDQTEKKYFAVVHGNPKEESGTISSYLAENSAQVVYSARNPKMGKLSHTQYRVLRHAKDYSLLEITLLTGRKNQIRVHLADIGHPIVGDRKYGPKDKVHKRIALHAFSIAFRHPFSGEPVHFECPVPAYFETLL
jgi:RluA family pseudouridine synthase